MNYYEIWCDLRDSSKDLDFCDAVNAYLGYLKGKGLVEGFKITRRKFGFAPDGFPEFHISIAFRDLTQMESAFFRAASRDAEVEPLHKAVYNGMTNGKFALYRDFPDEVRVR
jgi:hypothetical protein